MDKSLKIEKVRVTDEGVYICRAENAIGFIEAHVKLIVSGKLQWMAVLNSRVNQLNLAVA